MQVDQPFVSDLEDDEPVKGNGAERRQPVKVKSSRPKATVASQADDDPVL